MLDLTKTSKTWPKWRYHQRTKLTCFYHQQSLTPRLNKSGWSTEPHHTATPVIAKLARMAVVYMSNTTTEVRLRHIWSHNTSVWSSWTDGPNFIAHQISQSTIFAHRYNRIENFLFSSRLRHFVHYTVKLRHSLGITQLHSCICSREVLQIAETKIVSASRAYAFK